jgi:hypothetical protein
LGKSRGSDQRPTTGRTDAQNIGISGTIGQQSRSHDR